MADEEEELTEEKVAEYKDAFQVFATLGNGTAIEAEKLGALMHALGLNLRADEVKDLIHEVDEDGSGEIDFSYVLLHSRRRGGPDDEEAIPLQLF